MQDQKCHISITIASLIIGNDLSDRRRRPGDQDANPTKSEAAAALPDAAVPTMLAEASEKEQPVAQNEVEAQPSPEEGHKHHVHKIIGKAVGTIVLACVVWKIFGGCCCEREE